MTHREHTHTHTHTHTEEIREQKSDQTTLEAGAEVTQRMVAHHSSQRQPGERQTQTREAREARGVRQADGVK